MSTTIRNVSRIFANNRTDRRVDFSRKEVRGVVMGIFWTLMVTVSLVYGAVSGRLSAVTAAALEGASAAVELVLAMAGALCLWSGVLELMRRSGMAAGLSRLLRPVLRRLLPGQGGTRRRWPPSAPTSAPTCWGWATPPHRRAYRPPNAWRWAAAAPQATSCAGWWC